MFLEQPAVRVLRKSLSGLYIDDELRVAIERDD
jgi:hypothetical protein